VVEEKSKIKCGPCDVVVEKDEKGRPTLTPYCPPDENGQPVVSEEVKALNNVLHSEEVVLRPPKVKKD